MLAYTSNTTLLTPVLQRSWYMLYRYMIQGSRFFVGRKGATLGRRQTNTIAFSHESNGTVMGIDASISGEHARIVYDEDGDFLHIMDGTPTKVRLVWCDFVVSACGLGLCLIDLFVL